jgi:hypothetical protein
MVNSPPELDIEIIPEVFEGRSTLDQFWGRILYFDKSFSL